MSDQQASTRPLAADTRRFGHAATRPEAVDHPAVAAAESVTA